MADTTRDIVLRMEGTVNAILDKVESLDHTVNGNAKPGLKADVQDIQGRVGKLEERHCSEDKKTERRSERGWDLRKGMILIGFTQVLSLLGLAFALYAGLK